MNLFEFQPFVTIPIEKRQTKASKEYHKHAKDLDTDLHGTSPVQWGPNKKELNEYMHNGTSSCPGHRALWRNFHWLQPHLGPRHPQAHLEAHLFIVPPFLRATFCTRHDARCPLVPTASKRVLDRVRIRVKVRVIMEIDLTYSRERGVVGGWWLF